MSEESHIAALSFKGVRYEIETFGASDNLSRDLLKGGHWEPSIMEYIRSALQQEKNTAFIDIGANLGTHTAVAAVSGAKKVCAFECNPATVSLLRKTVTRNGWEERVKVWDLAVSDRAAAYNFKLVPGMQCVSFIHETHVGWPGSIHAEKPVTGVALDTLDLGLEEVERVVLKIDIEGHELRALKGMPALLANPKLSHCILELNPNCSEQEDLFEEIELLAAAGFRYYTLLFNNAYDSWEGYELKEVPVFPQISKEVMCRLLEAGNILEVAFTRGGE